MNSALRFAATLGVGAGVMYLLDPDRGRYRLAKVKDKAAAAANQTNRFFGRAARDMRNRSQGMVQNVKSLMGDAAASNDALRARVQSKIGHAVSHAGAIEVHAARGIVTLTGDVLKSEVDQLLKTAGAVKGVRAIDNQLKVHSWPGRIPSLQGVGTRLAGWKDKFRTPALQLLAGAAGTAAIAIAASRVRPDSD